jgi:hypothetical protein
MENINKKQLKLLVSFIVKVYGEQEDYKTGLLCLARD